MKKQKKRYAQQMQKQTAPANHPNSNRNWKNHLKNSVTPGVVTRGSYSTNKYSVDVGDHRIKYTKDSYECVSCDFEKEIPQLIIESGGTTLRAYKMFLLGRIVSIPCADTEEVDGILTTSGGEEVDITGFDVVTTDAGHGDIVNEIVDARREMYKTRRFK